MCSGVVRSGCVGSVLCGVVYFRCFCSVVWLLCSVSVCGCSRRLRRSLLLTFSLYFKVICVFWCCAFGVRWFRFLLFCFGFPVFFLGFRCRVFPSLWFVCWPPGSGLVVPSSFFFVVLFGSRGRRFPTFSDVLIAPVVLLLVSEPGA